MQAAAEAGIGSVETARSYERTRLQGSKEVMSKSALAAMLTRRLMDPTLPVQYVAALAGQLARIQGYDKVGPDSDPTKPSASMDDYLKSIEDEEAETTEEVVAVFAPDMEKEH